MYSDIQTTMLALQPTETLNSKNQSDQHGGALQTVAAAGGAVAWQVYRCFSASPFAGLVPESTRDALFQLICDLRTNVPKDERFLTRHVNALKPNSPDGWLALAAVGGYASSAAFLLLSLTLSISALGLCVGVVALLGTGIFLAVSLGFLAFVVLSSAVVVGVVAWTALSGYMALSTSRSVMRYVLSLFPESGVSHVESGEESCGRPSSEGFIVEKLPLNLPQKLEVSQSNDMAQKEEHDKAVSVVGTPEASEVNAVRSSTTERTSPRKIPDISSFEKTSPIHNAHCETDSKELKSPKSSSRHEGQEFEGEVEISTLGLASNAPCEGCVPPLAVEKRADLEQTAHTHPAKANSGAASSQKAPSAAWRNPKKRKNRGKHNNNTIHSNQNSHNNH